MRFVSLAILFAIAASGCSSPGPVFAPVDPPLTWPAAPARARIAYVGQISTNDDLKPAGDALSSIGEVVFGKKDGRGLLTPFALCTDNADRLFVADTGAQLVHVFDLKTRGYEQWKPSGKVPFTQPVGVAWDPSGRLIVSDSTGGCLFVFDTSGKYVGEMAMGIVKKPAGIVIDPVSRRIFVADVAAHQVFVFSPEGALLSTIGSRGEALGQFNYPTNLALDSQGNLYVADSLNFRVQVFDPSLKAIRSIGRAGDVPGYLSQPKGIALDGDDHLYVVDTRQELVQVFDKEKRLLLYFGGQGHGPGQFWLPAGICIDSRNRIWIADAYNRRVSVFDYLPEKQP